MLPSYLIVGAALFVLGLIGFLTRRNLIIIFLCTELMFQGVIVNLVAFARFPLDGQPRFDGHVFALFLLAIAAAEAALALALVILLYRHGKSLDAGDLKMLRDD